MKNIPFYFYAICLFLMTMILTNCTATDLKEEVGVENEKFVKESNKILDEDKERPLQKIEKEDIKVPSQG